MKLRPDFTIFTQHVDFEQRPTYTRPLILLPWEKRSDGSGLFGGSTGALPEPPKPPVPAPTSLCNGPSCAAPQQAPPQIPTTPHQRMPIGPPTPPTPPAPNNPPQGPSGVMSSQVNQQAPPAAPPIPQTDQPAPTDAGGGGAWGGDAGGGGSWGEAAGGGGSWGGTTPPRPGSFPNIGSLINQGTQAVGGVLRNPEQFVGRVLERHPQFADPATLRAAGMDRLAQRYTPQQQAQPGFMDQIGTFWRNLSMPQQIMLALGLSLGAVSLLGGMTGNLGGGMGSLLGIGGLGMAAYGAGLFDENSDLRRHLSTTFGGRPAAGAQPGAPQSGAPNGAAGANNTIPAAIRPKITQAITSGNYGAAAALIPRLGINRSHIAQMGWLPNTPEGNQRIATELTTAARAAGWNDFTITPQQAGVFRAWAERNPNVFPAAR